MKKRTRKPIWQVITVISISFAFIFSLVNKNVVEASNQEFLRRVSNAAVEMARETGRFPSVAIAQAIEESGWGTSRLSRTHNNILGIKASSNTFRRFDSIEGAMHFYGRLFTSSPGLRRHYAKFLNAKTPNEAAYALEYTYAFSSGYGNRLIQLMKTYNLYKYDQIAFGTKQPVLAKASTPVASKVNQANVAKEKAQAEKIAKEKAQKEQAEKIAKEKAQAEKIAKERAEKAKAEEMKKVQELIRLEKNKKPSLKYQEAYDKLVAELAKKYNLLLKSNAENIEFNGFIFQLKEKELSVLDKGE